MSKKRHDRRQRIGLHWAERLAVLGAAVLLALPHPALALDGDVSGVTLLDRLFVGIPHDVVLVEPLAYVALDTGLHVYDIGQADSPLELGHLYLPSPALDLAIVGSLAYVANGEAGLQIVDVSEPYDPIWVGSLPTFGTEGVAVQGNVAYLAEASKPPVSVFGVRTVDVSTPSALVELGFVPLINGALDIEVVGATAYVGIGSEMGRPDHGLATLDVSTPASPILLGYLDTGLAVNDIDVAGGVAYLATGFPLAGSFVTADVSAPASPTMLSATALGDAGMGVSVVSGIAYVAARALGLLSYDVGLPDSPVLLDSLATGRESWAVAATGADLAYVGERSSIAQAAFTAVNTPPPPGSLSELFAWPYAEATDVDALHGLAYLLRRDALHIFDASDPAALTLMSTWAPPGADLAALDADGTLAAIAQGTSVRLVDIGDPYTPDEQGVARLASGIAVRPVLDDTTLYVVNGLGFETFDVANPSGPHALGEYISTGWASAIAIDKGTAYLVAGEDLQVIDVSAPSAPTLIGSLALADQLYGVAAGGDVVVLAGLANYLHVVDVSSPSNPVLEGSLSGGTGFDVRLEGTHAFVAAGVEGLLVVNISNPASPSLEAFYDTSGTAERVASEASSIFLATSASQHWVMACDSCPSDCAVFASVTSPDPDVCEGTPVNLDGTQSSHVACDSDTLEYQWYEDGFLINGATSPFFTVLREQPNGVFRYSLQVTCEGTPSCMGWGFIDITITEETWPTIAANSLKLAKTPLDRVLHWSIESGSGESNVHLVIDKTLLEDLHLDLGTVIDTTSGTTINNNFEPPMGTTAFYRVYGRGSCSGASLAP